MTEAVDLCVVVRAAIGAVSGVAQRKSIRLDSVLDDFIGPVPGDPVRLQQVVSNLLTNAIKFTPTGGRVSVTVDTANEWARIEVTDNRSRNTRLRDGLDLVLATMQHVVDQHGGTVRAASRGAGRGATFTVVLPLSTLDDDVSTLDDVEHSSSAMT